MLIDDAYIMLVFSSINMIEIIEENTRKIYPVPMLIHDIFYFIFFYDVIHYLSFAI